MEESRQSCRRAAKRVVELERVMREKGELGSEGGGGGEGEGVNHCCPRSIQRDAL